MADPAVRELLEGMLHGDPGKRPNWGGVVGHTLFWLGDMEKRGRVLQKAGGLLKLASKEVKPHMAKAKADAQVAKQRLDELPVTPLLSEAWLQIVQVSFAAEYT